MTGFKFIDLKVEASSKIANSVPNNTILEVSEKTVYFVLIVESKDL